VYTLDNAAFGRGDADVLYSIIRDKKPGKIIEIGSGNSTLLICQAIRANSQEAPSYRCEFVAIEPYPPAYLSPAPAELTRVEAKFVQKIDIEEFASLKADDILFIDSSHTVKIGSDTVYELLSILPALAPGVLIHVHDIFTPHEYPETWLRDGRFFWNEQYMLEAFLSYNKDFEVILPLHAITKKLPELMTELIPSYDTKRHTGQSFWMRRR
jgi:predicted O-methyltransferase YrrM